MAGKKRENALAERVHVLGEELRAASESLATRQRELEACAHSLAELKSSAAQNAASAAQTRHSLDGELTAMRAQLACALSAEENSARALRALTRELVHTARRLRDTLQACGEGSKQGSASLAWVGEGGDTEPLLLSCGSIDSPAESVEGAEARLRELAEAVSRAEARLWADKELATLHRRCARVVRACL
jgi:hypothetical protein